MHVYTEGIVTPVDTSQFGLDSYNLLLLFLHYTVIHVLG